jgi:CheY-like chemotaxis protein
LQPSLNNVPVVVLTSSPEERDRQKAAELGARAYFVKPPTAQSVKEMMSFLNPHHENMTALAYASSISVRV